MQQFVLPWAQREDLYEEEKAAYAAGGDDEEEASE